LRPWGDDEVAVELYGLAGASYELWVFDTSTGKEVGHAATNPRQSDRLSAAVRFAPARDHSYGVRVRHIGGPAGDFHLTTTFASLACTTPGANVCFPGDGKEVVPRPKPDLVAVVPFPSSWRPGPFGGTSAAAPQAAALAALCWSRHADWSAARVRQALQSAAIDLNTPGPDYETGYGLIHLPDK